MDRAITILKPYQHINAAFIIYIYLSSLIFINFNETYTNKPLK